MKLILTMLCVAVITCFYSCNSDNNTTTPTSKTFKDTSHSTMSGRLFSDTGDIYQYTWRAQGGVHVISHFDSIRKENDVVFQFVGGNESLEAKFIDCNFDSIRDMVINVGMTGIITEENCIIILNTKDGFKELRQFVSYPQFNRQDKVVISRYQSSRDAITINKYSWRADSLLLTGSQTMPEATYNAAFGPLKAIPWQSGIF